MKNPVQRKITSSPALTKDNIIAHAQIRPVCMSQSQMSSVFTSVPPLFGSAQAFLLRLAQLEAQLVLNMISNVAAGNNTSSWNPFLPLLQPTGFQRSSFLNLNQHPVDFTLSRLLHKINVDSVAQMVSRPSSSVSEINSAIANKKNGDLLAVIREKTSVPILKNTTAPLPTSEEPLLLNHHGKHLIFKPDVDCLQYKSMTAKAMVPPDRPQIRDVELKQQTKLHFPTENLIKALASLGLSLEDLELLSHFPDNQLTTEKLPLIIQDLQQRKAAKYTKDGHAILNSSNQKESSYANGKHHDQLRMRCSEWQGSVPPNPYGQSCGSHSCKSIRTERSSPSELIHDNFSTRDSSGRGSYSSLKRLQHGPAEVTSWRPASVYFSSRSKCSLRCSFVSRGYNKTRYYATKTTSLHKSATSKATRKGHQRVSFPVRCGTSETRNVQIPVTTMTAKTSAQTNGVIRVSGIPHYFSESELIKMASPFGDPVEVLTATEIDMTTGLEWKKALLMFPSEFSAQEMVKVYSAIPVHMRQQSLELVPQTLNFSSPVSLFQAFVGPSLSNGLLSPLDHLLVVCNVPDQPCAATGVLRLIKPFGQVFRTLVFNGSKMDVDQCPWNQSSVQMVLEMESASVAVSVYEWSQKIPCLYHNHHLYFLRGCNIEKNTSKVISA